MSTKWVVVAHQAGARIFKHKTKSAPLELVEGFSNPKAELHTHELVSDRPGRGFSSAGGGVRHALSAGDDSHEVVSNKFAVKIADFLDQARKKNRYDTLVLVAEPKFLGKIKAALTQSTAKTVALTISKDLMKIPNNELLEHLHEIGGVA